MHIDNLCENFYGTFLIKNFLENLEKKNLQEYSCIDIIHLKLSDIQNLFIDQKKYLIAILPKRNLVLIKNNSSFNNFVEKIFDIPTKKISLNLTNEIIIENYLNFLLDDYYIKFIKDKIKMKLEELNKEELESLYKSLE